MNILFVSDSPFNPVVGGLERVTDVLSKELIKRGHSVYYLCGKIRPSYNYLLDYEYPAKLYQLPNYGLFDNYENKTFYKYLQSDLKIDIVINQRGLGGLFNSLLTLTHTKLVSVIHSVPDCDIIIYLNKLVELTVPPFAKLKKIIKKYFSCIISYYWKRKAMADLENKYNELVQNSDAIVTLSNNDVEIFKGIIKASYVANIISIPNPNTFNTAEVSLEKKEKVILYVGRLTKSEKEPLRLLKIWKYLHRKYFNWQLFIIGEGEEKNNMLEYVRKQQLNNVFFEGQQSDVAQYYKKATFVCLTSNFEGWGMVLTEGMQYGCIPVTFDNYGAAFDIIDDGLNGCLIPTFDLKKYASRLSELMSDEDKRFEMSNAAIEKVRMFSVANVVDKWETLFRSL